MPGRWTNPSQPQTLVIAVFLLYINAAFGFLDVLRAGRLVAFTGLGIVYYGVRIGGGVLGGYGLSSDRKWGYVVALATAIAPFALSYLVLGNPFAADIISLMFEIALVALLLHPQSREYQRIWFK
jgi:hypothetical protein